MHFEVLGRLPDMDDEQLLCHFTKWMVEYDNPDDPDIRVVLDFFDETEIGNLMASAVRVRKYLLKRRRVK